MKPKQLESITSMPEANLVGNAAELAKVVLKREVRIISTHERSNKSMFIGGMMADGVIEYPFSMLAVNQGRLGQIINAITNKEPKTQVHTTISINSPQIREDAPVFDPRVDTTD